LGELILRNLDEALVSLLSQRAAVHGRSPEAEAAEILRRALPATAADASAGDSFGDAMRALVRRHGAVDVDLPPRENWPEPPDLAR
jgi:plasmid stability protein